MKWGHSAWGPKPGIDGDVLVLPVTEATVVGDADVLLQLWDLWVSEQMWKVRPCLWDSPAQNSSV